MGHPPSADRGAETAPSAPNATKTDGPENAVALATRTLSYTTAAVGALRRAARALVNRIQRRLIDREYTRLGARYQRHLKHNPEDASVWKLLAKLHETRHEKKEASDCYRLLASMYQGRGETEEAAACYRQLIRLGCLEPARVYRELTDLYIDHGRFDEAAVACKRVVEIYLAEGQRTAATGYLRSLPALGRFAPDVRAELEMLLERPKVSSTATPPRTRETSRLALPEPPPAAPTPPPALPVALTDRWPVPAKAVQAKPASIFLEGTLGRITIFDLVQMVEDNRITGRLLIKSRGYDGVIHFNAGRIVAAENNNGLLGHDALKVLFTIDSGAFSVEYTDRPSSDELGSRSNTGLLVDVLRVIEEERRESSF